MKINWNHVFIVTSIILAITVLFVANELRKEGTTCLKNPIEYGMKQLLERNPDFTCTCSDDKGATIYSSKGSLELNLNIPKA